MDIGDKYARLTIIAKPFIQKHASYVDCRCVCGTKRTIRVRHLKTGKTRSCGCLRKEVVGRGAKELYPIRIGDKYGKLTILEKGWRYFTDVNGRNCRVEICRCLCDCGTIKEGVMKHNIIHGKSLSCGCLHAERGIAKRFRDTAGDIIGVMTLISLEKLGDSRSSDIWNAKCKCGNDKRVTIGTMLNHTECSCRTSKHIGVTYNSLTVLSVFNKDGNQFANCLCACGTEKVIRVSSVVTSASKTCGHKFNKR
jgi:hypothetical protein